MLSGENENQGSEFRVQGYSYWFQVSAQPLAGEAASLINKRKFRNEFS
jgi:hypothetical protein